ncbi:MAG: enoyl-CoA hydratase, partial [Porticoccaceae bacterium]|nr:enoyl-CoA hydratase [Porticoccaceae bacterium]
MEYQEILYNTLDGVATITINRPDTLNALTSLTQAEIKHALFISDTTEEVIGTVITGAGRGFCSGVDMKSLGKISDDGKRTQDAFKHLEVSFENENKNFLGSPAYFLALKKPVIAAINGACAGLGFSYATFCDMRFMDRTAKLVTSFSPRGLIAEHGTSWILPKIIGPSHALDLMWTSRRVDAEEAYRIGYANRLSENGEVLKEAQDFILNLAKTAAPYSLMMMKKQIYQHLNQDLGPSNTESTTWMDESLERDDFKEGIKSFLEKRSPNFKRIK